VIGGEDVAGLAPVERRTAMMFQSYALFRISPSATTSHLRCECAGSRDRALQAADRMMEKVR